MTTNTGFPISHPPLLHPLTLSPIPTFFPTSIPNLPTSSY